MSKKDYIEKYMDTVCFSVNYFRTFAWFLHK